MVSSEGQQTTASPCGLSDCRPGCTSSWGCGEATSRSSKRSWSAPVSRSRLRCASAISRREDEAARDLVEHGERLLFTRSVARSQSRRDLDERARDLFMAALEEDAAYARAAYLLGHVQQLLGNRQESLDAYLLALRIDPTDVEARVQLAGVLVEVGDADAAFRELTDAVRLADPTDELYAMLARVYWDKGAWEQAVREARRAIALNASNGQAYLWKADALRQLAEHDGMSPVVRQIAVSRSPATTTGRF